MKTPIHIWIFCILLAVSGFSHADSLGFGLLPFYGSLKVKDPEGASETIGSFHFVNIVSSYKTGRDNRFWGEVSIIDFESDAGINQVSQDANIIMFTTAYHWRKRINKHFKPWLGIGLNFSQAEYDGRFIEQTGGFFKEGFEKRDESELGYTVQIMNEFSLQGTDRDISIGISYIDSFDDGLNGLRIHTGILF